MAVERPRPVSRLRALRPTIGLILYQQGRISREDLAEAVELQGEVPSAKIGAVLRLLTGVTERDLTIALSRQFRLPWVNFVRNEIPHDTVSLLPAVVARAFRVLPIDYRPDEAVLRLAITGPPDFAFLVGLRKMLDLSVTPLVADESRIEALLDRYYPEMEARKSRFRLAPTGWGGLATYVASLASTQQARELRLESFGHRLWVRLLEQGAQRDVLVELDTSHQTTVAS
jgi:MshEN domain